MSDSIAELQAARKAAEREPRDWDTYRQELIDSGMVEEAAQRRHIEEGYRESEIRGVPFMESTPGDPTLPTLIDALWEDRRSDLP